MHEKYFRLGTTACTWILIFLSPLCSTVSADGAKAGQVSLVINDSAGDFSLSHRKENIPTSAKRIVTDKNGKLLLFTVDDMSGNKLYQGLAEMKNRLYFDYQNSNGDLAGGAVETPDNSFVVRYPELPGEYYISFYGITSSDDIAKAGNINVAGRTLEGRLATRFSPPDIKQGTKFETKKIVDNGDDAKHLVWVFMGDGYRDAEQNKFLKDVDSALKQILNVEPWSAYGNYVNVYAIEVISNQSGADKPDDRVSKDTFLDASYGFGAMRRLLVVNNSKVLDTANENTPFFDSVFVIVNDSEYGGSGGSISVFNYTSPNISIHEYGHSFGGLADEYETPYPGYPPGDSEPNVTYQTLRENIKWNRWILDSTPLPTPPSQSGKVTGLFEGARYLSTGIYRPTFDYCLMRSNTPKNFCEVCREAITIHLYKTLDGANEISPDNSATISFNVEDTADFALTLKHPEGHDLLVQWQADGVGISWAQETSLSYPCSFLWSGSHTISATITDNSDFVRNDPDSYLSQTISWNLAVDPGTAIPNTLAVNISQENAGRTIPDGAHTIIHGSPFVVSAYSYEGYNFINWTCVLGDAIFANASSSSTQVTIHEDSAITANFANDIYLAPGSVASIWPKELSETLTQFTQRPKITLKYSDPVKDSPGKKASMSPVGKMSPLLPAPILRADFNKRICLYDKAFFKNKLISTVLSENPIANYELEGIYVDSKDAGVTDKKLNRKVFLVAPVIQSVSGDFTGKGGKFSLAGKYFGATAPKILLEYTKDGKPKYKTCKLDKTSTYLYKNSKGVEKKSCMKVLFSDTTDSEETGHSQVSAIHPGFQAGELATGYVIIDNGSGLAMFKYWR